MLEIMVKMCQQRVETVFTMATVKEKVDEEQNKRRTDQSSFSACLAIADIMFSL